VQQQSTIEYASDIPLNQLQINEVLEKEVDDIPDYDWDTIEIDDTTINGQETHIIEDSVNDNYPIQ
tara:strand:- start:720 stop:917 length:198 start_codon:yes stop_codon:yes gene_type:complete